MGLAVALGAMAGCGNTYRPVETAINPVGPAGQPQKFAVAVSTPTQIPVNAGEITFGTNSAWSSTQTYALNVGVSYLGTLYVSLQNGNLNQNPATAAAYWSPLSNGLLTMVDFAGDTVLVTAALGVNPYYFILNAAGNTGYTLNSDKTVNSFDVSTSLIASQVLETTLLPGANPVSVFPGSANVYIADPGVQAVDQLTGEPAGLKQDIPVAAGYSPVYVVGSANAARAYALNKATNGSPGQAEAIETGENTVSATLTVGRGPVYGIMNATSQRAFVLNHTDGTVTAINTVTNALDQFLSDVSASITGFSITNNVVTFTAANTFAAGNTIAIAGLSNGTYLNGQILTVLATGLSSTQFEASFTHANIFPTSDSGTASGLTSTVTVGTGPVWVDLAPTLNELVVLNEGTGTSNGSVSVVSIPLCSSTATAITANCDTTNPADATSFGTVVATVPVGINPIMISVLSDGSRAYVANAGVANLPCAPNGIAVAGITTTCTVSVVNLTSNTVTATIPIAGHPAYIATTDASPTGKVYVVCNDSQVLTVIETDTDSLDTTVPLQGYGVSVRMTAP